MRYIILRAGTLGCLDSWTLIHLRLQLLHLFIYQVALARRLQRDFGGQGNWSNHGQIYHVEKWLRARDPVLL